MYTMARVGLTLGILNLGIKITVYKSTSEASSGPDLGCQCSKPESGLRFRAKVAAVSRSSEPLPRRDRNPLLVDSMLTFGASFVASKYRDALNFGTISFRPPH